MVARKKPTRKSCNNNQCQCRDNSPLLNAFFILPECPNDGRDKTSENKKKQNGKQNPVSFYFHIVISLYTLGPYRKNLTEEQKKEYSNLFKEYFLKTFVSRLTDYSEPKIDVISSDKKNEKYTIVSSILLATEKKSEVKIDWRVYTKDPDKPFIRDLIIEGLSLARTQKEEFSSIIESNDGDINALFNKLREFINS